MNNDNSEREVRIHIDRRPVTSPNPTTGEVLYILAKVPLGELLYRSVLGNNEDELVPLSTDEVVLTKDEHFYTDDDHSKAFTVFMNGRPKEIKKRKQSFDEIVGQALNPVPTGPLIEFSVTYQRGPRANTEGNMVQGQIIKLRDGMRFDVGYTDRS